MHLQNLVGPIVSGPADFTYICCRQRHLRAFLEGNVSQLLFRRIVQD